MPESFRTNQDSFRLAPKPRHDARDGRERTPQFSVLVSYGGVGGPLSD